MKSTDTILGAFAVLGFVLLAFFAFAGPTSNSELDTSQLTQQDEDLLTTTNDELTEEEIVTLEDEDEIAVPIENDEAVLDEVTEQLTQTDLLAGVTPEEIRSGVENFLQGTDPSAREELIDTLTSEDSEVEINVSGDEQKEVEIESEELTDEVEEELADSIEAETEIDTEQSRPGRVSQFFSNLFGGDNEDDNDIADIGGSTEDAVNDSDMTIDSYVVKSGDNLWNIMKTELDYTDAQAATALQNLNTGDYDDLGLTSGDEDLIFTGQTLDLSVLSLS
jgi:hypothetical protein